MNREQLTPGTLLGRYQIVRSIGAGGMGAVYEAIQLELEKRVAVKTLWPALASQPNMRTRFFREGRAAVRVRHPNAADVWDVGEHEGTLYLVMEFLEGESLSARIAREGALPIDDVVALTLPLCAAIAAAHREGIVHRDLKPANLFLSRTRDGVMVPKVLDFGISKMVSDGMSQEELTASAAILGTPHYMSPEQIRSTRDVDGRTDVYALGVILYECVTGRRPFSGDPLYNLLAAIVEGERPSPRRHRPDLPERFECVITRAMSANVDARFESVTALGNALLDFVDGRTAAQWEPVFGTRSPQKEPPPERSDGPRDASLDASTLGSMQLVSAADIAPPVQRPAAMPVWRVSLAIGAVVLGVALGGLARQPQRRAPLGDAGVSRPPVTQPPPPPSGFLVTFVVSPRSARIELDGVAVGVGVLQRELPLNGATHELSVTAVGYQPQTLVFTDRSPPAEIVLEPLFAAAPPRSPSPPTSGAPAARARGRSRRPVDNVPSYAPAGGYPAPVQVGPNGAIDVN